jgi:restriction endonuclease S subunit
MSALLDFVTYYELSNWSVAHLLQNHFNYNQSFPLVKIGSFLKRNKTLIEIDDDTVYTRVTIRLYNNGVLVRDTEIGKNIGTKKQFVIKEGQFLLSKIDARNGAFGLATKEVDGAIITADFLAFDLDTSKIDPHFLVLMTTTKKFMQFAQSASSGTTGRQRIDESKFLETKIPLPSLETQQRIIQNYQAKILQADTQEQKANELENRIEFYLYNQLGIEINEQITLIEKRLLNFVRYEELTRWDPTFLLNNITLHSKYELINVGNIIDKFMVDQNKNSLRFDSSKFSEHTFKYIGMESIEKDSGRLIAYQDVVGSDIKSQTIKLPKNYFLYGKLRPYLNKYYFNTNDIDSIIVSSEFFVFSTKDINPLYFKSLISSSIVQQQIKNLMKGARMPRIGEDTFKNIKIPLPPLEIQNLIVDHIETIKKQITILNETVQPNRTNALVDFEKEIFDEA